MKNKFKIKTIHFAILLPLPILTLIQIFFKKNIYVNLSFIIFALAFCCYLIHYYRKKKDVKINNESARQEVFVLFLLFFISMILSHFIKYLFH